jgi:hypothetical protein
MPPPGYRSMPLGKIKNIFFFRTRDHLSHIAHFDTSTGSEKIRKLSKLRLNLSQVMTYQLCKEHYGIFSNF